MNTQQHNVLVWLTIFINISYAAVGVHYNCKITKSRYKIYVHSSRRYLLFQIH